MLGEIRGALGVEQCLCVVAGGAELLDDRLGIRHRLALEGFGDRAMRRSRLGEVRERGLADAIVKALDQVVVTITARA